MTTSTALAPSSDVSVTRATLPVNLIDRGVRRSLAGVRPPDYGGLRDRIWAVALPPFVK